MDKIFSTTNKQLRQLRTRGMVISNGSRAKRIIEMENYYNLIMDTKVFFWTEAILGRMKPICPEPGLRKSMHSIYLIESLEIFLSVTYSKSRTM